MILNISLTEEAFRKTSSSLSTGSKVARIRLNQAAHFNIILIDIVPTNKNPKKKERESPHFNHT
jgi:hypothetical protein